MHIFIYLGKMTASQKFVLVPYKQYLELIEAHEKGMCGRQDVSNDHSISSPLFSSEGISLSQHKGNDIKETLTASTLDKGEGCSIQTRQETERKSSFNSSNLDEIVKLVNPSFRRQGERFLLFLLAQPPSMFAWEENGGRILLEGRRLHDSHIVDVMNFFVTPNSRRVPPHIHQICTLLQRLNIPKSLIRNQHAMNILHMSSPLQIPKKNRRLTGRFVRQYGEKSESSWVSY